MRKPIIAGNWKMNLTPSAAAELVASLCPRLTDAACEVVVCPPFIDLPIVAQTLRGSCVALGAQNMHFEEKGAFTGEISAAMLREIGVQYVILGHSERREYFAETDETVNKKTHAALNHGLTPIVCVGESLAQRESGETDAWIAGQTKAALAGLTAEQAAQVVIAYEPIWAIGTGRTATDEQANDAIAAIRNAVEAAFGADTSQAVRIQYGGSMNAQNAAGLMAQPQIDGGLIGGASLKAEDFATIVAAASATV